MVWGANSVMHEKKIVDSFLLYNRVVVFSRLTHQNQTSFEIMYYNAHLFEMQVVFLQCWDTSPVPPARGYLILYIFRYIYLPTPSCQIYFKNSSEMYLKHYTVMQRDTPMSDIFEDNMQSGRAAYP